MASTVNLLSRGTLVSRWNDRRGAWVPLPGFEPKFGEGYAIIWSPTDDDLNGEIHVRYKFPGGAEVTQARLHSLLDTARSLGLPEISLD
ncbi:hypothetical protein [Agromyces sp. SYSU T00266]|uniref:hypothetical protein n=1 Tax=Agromyces zhanjiangensis TaxID=3158562 RepID=UPI00339A95FF